MFANILILPILASATVGELVIPVLLETDKISIRARATFEDQPDVEDLFTINTITQFSSVRSSDIFRWVTGISLLSGDGNEYRATNRMYIHVNNNHRSQIGVGPNSEFHNAFSGGFMLVPGRWGHGFLQDTAISMVLNPDESSAERFCEEGSLFYVRNYGQGKFKFNAEIKVSNEVDDAQWSPLGRYHIDTSSQYDHLPVETVDSILNVLIPGRPFIPRRLLFDDVPEIIHNCDIGNGGYPSILLRLSDLSRLDEDPNDHILKGTIVFGPEDYLEQLEGRECRIMIRKSTSPSLGLNFLKKMATHIKSNSIGFCDPAIPPTNQ